MLSFIRTNHPMNAFYFNWDEPGQSQRNNYDHYDYGCEHSLSFLKCGFVLLYCRRDCFLLRYGFHFSGLSAFRE